MISDLEYYRVKDNVNSYYRIESESKKELLLNKYPNAAAAYSLRLLDGYYRGPLVRIRRDSDDGVEVDVYPDYNNELSLDSLVSNVAVHTTNDGIEDTDATFLKSLQSLGEFVSNPNYVDGGTAVDATVCVWYDQSSTDGVPNDNDASQSVALNQPLIVSSGVIVTENGKPALAEHSGVFKELQVATINLSADSGSFFAVNKPTTSGNEIYALGSNFRLSTNAGRNGFFAGASYIYSTSSSANQALRVAFGDVSDAVAVNGASLTTGGAGNLALTLTSFLVFSSFQEFVVYTSDQSTNRSDIEEDINSFYQIDGYTPTPKLIDLTQDLAVQNGGTTADGTPAAAYSLRLLSSTYNGPLVRIRRTIDNTEVDVYPDSDGEFSIYSTIEDGGTELTTGVTGGSTDKTTLHEFLYGQDTDCMVVRWYDQASGNHATQDVATNQPKIYDSATGVVTENGKPAIQTDGSDDTMSLTSTISFSDLTWFTVTKKADTNNNGSIIFYGGSGAAYAGDDVDNRGNPYLQAIGAPIIRNTLGNTSASGGEINQHLSYYNRNGTNASGGLNGEVKTEATVATTTFGLTELFQYGSSNYYNYEGLVQELVLYNSSKKSDRSGIESNINTYYNIY